MNLKSWLRRNFRLRQLRQLSERVLARLTGNFPPPSLLPRRPLIVPAEESASPAEETATAIESRHAGREVSLLSSERVRADLSYADALAPLRQLPADLKPEDLLLAIKNLSGTLTEEQSFFPLEVYLQSLPGEEGSAIEWAHYCRASRQPSIDILLSLTGQQTTPAHTTEPSVLLIYGRTVATDER